MTPKFEISCRTILSLFDLCFRYICIVLIFILIYLDPDWVFLPKFRNHVSTLLPVCVTQHRQRHRKYRTKRHKGHADCHAYRTLDPRRPVYDELSIHPPPRRMAGAGEEVNQSGASLYAGKNETNVFPTFTFFFFRFIPVQVSIIWLSTVCCFPISLWSVLKLCS